MDVPSNSGTLESLSTVLPSLPAARPPSYRVNASVSTFYSTLTPLLADLGTAAPNGRAVNSGRCKHCHEYHGKWHKACEASKEEKRNGKKRRRSA